MATQQFTLTGKEHQGSREGRERLVCYIEGGGLMAIWGDRRSRRNIEMVLAAGFPCIVECDPIPPGEYEAEHFGHTYWVPQSNHLEVLSDAKQQPK
jgi:hypothetical protein